VANPPASPPGVVQLAGTVNIASNCDLSLAPYSGSTGIAEGTQTGNIALVLTFYLSTPTITSFFYISFLLTALPMNINAGGQFYMLLAQYTATGQINISPGGILNVQGDGTGVGSVSIGGISGGGIVAINVTATFTGATSMLSY
jgi:hypothetical protein